MSGQWAADPYGRAQLRYWDGSTWTSHVCTNGVVSNEASAPPMSSPFASTSSSAPSPFGETPRASFSTAAPSPYPGPGPGAPPGYQPYGAHVVGSQTTSGKLIAAGVLEFIEAAFFLLFGIWAFAIGNDNNAGEFFDDISSGAVTFFAIAMVGIAIALITAGVGAVSGRQWGRVTTIVLQSIGLLLSLTTLTDSDAVGGGILLIAYCSTVLGLAIAGRPRR